MELAKLLTDKPNPIQNDSTNECTQVCDVVARVVGDHIVGASNKDTMSSIIFRNTISDLPNNEGAQFSPHSGSTLSTSKQVGFAESISSVVSNSTVVFITDECRKRINCYMVACEKSLKSLMSLFAKLEYDPSRDVITTQIIYNNLLNAYVELSTTFVVYYNKNELLRGSSSELSNIVINKRIELLVKHNVNFSKVAFEEMHSTIVVSMCSLIHIMITFINGICVSNTIEKCYVKDFKQNDCYLSSFVNMNNLHEKNITLSAILKALLKQAIEHFDTKLPKNKKQKVDAM